MNCIKTKKLIFADEYLKAMAENFHVDHFLCRQCDKSLANQRYVLKDDKPFCIDCFERHYANNCEACMKPIGVTERDLAYKDKHWHEQCFACNKCNDKLIDKPFGAKLDKVYCSSCFDLSFATRCDGCKQPFRAGSKKMEYRGWQWHDSCFCCCVCKQTIGSNSFIPKNDDIFCIKCYEDKYATRCVKCKKPIVSGGVTFRNEPWHKECFNCCNCNKSLAGQRFTTRELSPEPSSSPASPSPSSSSSSSSSSSTSSSSSPSKSATKSPTKSPTKTQQQTKPNQDQQQNQNKLETSTSQENKPKTKQTPKQSHNAFCIDCYNLLFAKKCHACGLAITGAGGTRFVTFEDCSWHNDCFLCSECQTSLVDRGFITYAPDSMLCGDCARLKLC